MLIPHIFCLKILSIESFVDEILTSVGNVLLKKGTTRLRSSLVLYSTWLQDPAAMAQQPWSDARQHAVHRMSAPWWDARSYRREAAVESGVAQQNDLPAYLGWPTTGPSDDKLLLKMRTSQHSGHVDWVSWTREVTRRVPKAMPRPPYAKVSTSAWHQNYGYIGTDGQIHWPTPQPSHRRVIGMAWNEASAKSAPRGERCHDGRPAVVQPAEPATAVPASATSQYHQKTLTQQLTEGQDLWAVLRCAYLAGADDGGGRPDGLQEVSEASEPAKFDDLDLAARTVQDRLQKLLQKTAQATAALSRRGPGSGKES